MDRILFYAKKSWPVATGAVVGYAYYHFIGCYNGQCAIQSNPFFSTLYGALVGAAFLLPSGKKESKAE